MKKTTSKAAKTAPKPSFHDGIRLKTEARKNPEARDQIALDRYAEGL